MVDETESEVEGCDEGHRGNRPGVPENTPLCLCPSQTARNRGTQLAPSALHLPVPGMGSPVPQVLEVVHKHIIVIKGSESFCKKTVKKKKPCKGVWTMFLGLGRLGMDYPKVYKGHYSTCLLGAVFLVPFQI